MSAEAAHDLECLAEHLRGRSETWAITTAAAISIFLEGEADSLDEAFGLQNGKGQSWRLQLTLDRRDRWLRRAAQEHSLSADDLAVALARYHADGWPRERTLPECPERHRGKVQECLWHALKSRPRPLSARHIRQIIGNEMRF